MRRNQLPNKARLRWACALAALAACMGGAPASAQAGDTLPPAGPVPAGSAAADAVKLAPGDVVKVEIWREKELSGEFMVEPSGTVVFPMLGPQPVAGIPLGEVRRRLLEGYRVRLRTTSISITPLRRVEVLGEVNKPGVYLVDPTVSLSGTVATAEGATRDGSLRRIQIVRDGQVYRAQVGPGTSLAAADVRSGDQIVVGQKSWVSRNSTFLVSMVLAVPTTLLTLVTLLDR